MNRLLNNKTEIWKLDFNPIQIQNSKFSTLVIKHKIRFQNDKNKKIYISLVTGLAQYVRK